MRICAIALAVGLALSPTIAAAQTVPVDPGAMGKGRPIMGTTQNLPSLDSADPYDAGPGFAPQLRSPSLTQSLRQKLSIQTQQCRVWLRT